MRSILEDTTYNSLIIINEFLPFETQLRVWLLRFAMHLIMHDRDAACALCIAPYAYCSCNVSNARVVDRYRRRARAHMHMRMHDGDIICIMVHVITITRTAAAWRCAQPPRRDHGCRGAQRPPGGELAALEHRECCDPTEQLRGPVSRGCCGCDRWRRWAEVVPVQSAAAGHEARAIALALHALA